MSSTPKASPATQEAWGPSGGHPGTAWCPAVSPPHGRAELCPGNLVLRSLLVSPALRQGRSESWRCSHILGVEQVRQQLRVGGALLLRVDGQIALAMGEAGLFHQPCDLGQIISLGLILLCGQTENI